MNFVYVTDKNVCDVGLTDKKIFIYGAGDYGYAIGDFLTKYGIENFSYCVDDNFFQTGKTFHGQKIFRLSEVLNDDVNLIFAIGDYEKFCAFTKKNSPECLYIIFDPYEWWSYDEKFMQSHEKDFENAAKLFEDDLSRKTLFGYLKAKKTGDITDDLQNVRAAGKNIYFNEITRPIFKGGGSAYVDCGTFDGENIEEYFEFVGDTSRPVYGFEPNQKMFDYLCEKFRDFKNVTIIDKGLWSEETVLKFSEQGHNDIEFKISTSDEGFELPVTSIDKFFSDKKVSFIKITVMTGDFEILIGAEKIILRDKPGLAFSMYGSAEDLFSVPAYIKALGDYKLYLRHHEIVSGRLVLYAVPK